MFKWNLKSRENSQNVVLGYYFVQIAEFVEESDTGKKGCLLKGLGATSAN